MGSAHQLTERNIIRNGAVDMEQTGNSRVNPMTLKCDLDLESV